MEKVSSILAIIDPGHEVTQVIGKSVAMARHFGAKLELFLCDADHAYALRRLYDASGADRARQACLAEASHYLENLRQSAVPDDVTVSIDAACESPLYEGIVHKVLKSQPDLVIKAAAGEHPLRRLTLDANDWQLARTCPVPLMLLRGKLWMSPLRIAAAVDVSEEETSGLTKEILHTAEYLALGCDARIDMLYSDRHANPKEREIHRTRLRELAHQFKVPTDRAYLLEGEPEDTLPAFAAQQHYDLLVLGALTHREGLTSLVGTLTSRLVDALDCDFVLVKSQSYCCPIAESAPATVAIESA